MWLGSFSTFVDWSAYLGFSIYSFEVSSPFDLNPGIVIILGFFFYIICSIKSSSSSSSFFNFYDFSYTFSAGFV